MNMKLFCLKKKCFDSRAKKKAEEEAVAKKKAEEEAAQREKEAKEAAEKEAKADREKAAQEAEAAQKKLEEQKALEEAERKREEEAKKNAAAAQAAKELEERRKREEQAAEKAKAVSHYCYEMPLEATNTEDDPQTELLTEKIHIAVPSAKAGSNVPSSWHLCSGEGYHEVLPGFKMKLPPDTKVDITHYGDRLSPGRVYKSIATDNQNNPYEIPVTTASFDADTDPIPDSLTAHDMPGKGLILVKNEMPIAFGITPRLPTQASPPPGSVSTTMPLDKNLICNLRNIGVVQWDNQPESHADVSGRMCAEDSAKGPLQMTANCCTDPIPLAMSLGYQEMHFRHAQVLMGDLRNLEVPKQHCRCSAGHSMELVDADGAVLERCVLGQIPEGVNNDEVKRRYCGSTSQSLGNSNTMRQTQAQIPIQQLAGAKRDYKDQYDWSSFQVLIAAMVIIGFLVAVWYFFKRPKGHRRLVEMAEIEISTLAEDEDMKVGNVIGRKDRERSPDRSSDSDPVKLIPIENKY